MSQCKYDDFEYGYGKCSSCTNSCDPIDININVTCCPSDCPPPPPNGDGCCCNEGIAEVLRFIRDEIQEEGLIQNPNNPQLDIFGINSTPLAGNATISTNPLDLTDDIVRVTTTANPRERFLVNCAIYHIDIQLDFTGSDITFEELKEAIVAAFDNQDFENCCCKDGVANLLSGFSSTTTVNLNLNNQNGNFNDVSGRVVAVNSDITWLDISNNLNQPALSVVSNCYVAGVTTSPL